MLDIRAWRRATHEVYVDGDKNIPLGLFDSNGRVALNLCKVCGAAEHQLFEQSCLARVVEAMKLKHEQQANKPRPTDTHVDVLFSLVYFTASGKPDKIHEVERILRLLQTSERVALTEVWWSDEPAAVASGSDALAWLRGLRQHQSEHNPLPGLTTGHVYFGPVLITQSDEQARKCGVVLTGPFLLDWEQHA